MLENVKMAEINPKRRGIFFTLSLILIGIFLLILSLRESNILIKLIGAVGSSLLVLIQAIVLLKSL